MLVNQNSSESNFENENNYCTLKLGSYDAKYYRDFNRQSVLYRFCCVLNIDNTEYYIIKVNEFIGDYKVVGYNIKVPMCNVYMFEKLDSSKMICIYGKIEEF